MYNGIGLTTPRGSGTSGHVMRNLSHLRPRDDYRSMQDRDMTVKHRAPDAAILEHDRKRKVEVQCLELQDELEDKGLAPEEVERQVDELRQRLTSQNRHSAGQTAERGSLKEFQTHELLAAKATDNSRFERAFGISRDFVPGESLNKEKQEERRIERQLEKERRNEELAERKRQYEEGLEKRKAEQAVRDAAQREERAANMERNRAEVEARAKDREARMREIQSDREKGVGRSVPRARNDLVDSYRPGDRATRQRSRSPPPGRADTRGRDRSYSRSPSRSRSRSRSDSRGRSRSRSASRSRSPPRRRVSKGRRDSRSASRSRSPPPRRGRERSRSRSVASRSRSRARDASRSPPPRRRSPPARRSPSPVNAGRNTSPKRTREASASGSEDMDVQSD